MSEALVIIDMQMVMEERIGAGRRQYVSPGAAENVAALVAACRQARKPFSMYDRKKAIRRRRSALTLLDTKWRPALRMLRTRSSSSREARQSAF
jgi:hypothetical protein